MFTVKVTYNGEIRKFSLPSDSFPTYDSIYRQLSRVFLIRGPIYFSKILFVPETGSRIPVGREAHSASQYDELTIPYRDRNWPNGLLRFTAIDEPQQVSPRPNPENQSRTNQVSSRSSPTFNDISGTSTTQNLFIDPVEYARANEERKAEMRGLLNSFIIDLNTLMSPPGDRPVSRGERPPSVTTPSTRSASSSNENHSTYSSTPVVDTHRDLPVTDDQNTSEPRIPGAFVSSEQPTPDSNISSDPMHYGISCGSCKNVVKGIRYKCQQCPDFDLCETCVAAQAIDEHIALQLDKDPEGDLHQFSEIRLPLIPKPVVHTGVNCDLCHKRVVGVRHKCIDCSNFDSCDHCITRIKETHPSTHQFVAIEIPGRVIIHTIRGNNDSRPERKLVKHYAQCDFCKSHIIGNRFKCLTCPDFDVCSDCRPTIPAEHPKHTFVIVETPQNLAPCDPDVKKKHYARCDNCNGIICGIRYKCFHLDCDDYDLCARCEALPKSAHPADHPLLKIRDPNTVIPKRLKEVPATPVPRAVVLPEPEPPKCTTAVGVSTDPPSERADASVSVEIRPETNDASTSTDIAVVEASVATEPMDIIVAPHTTPLEKIIEEKLTDADSNTDTEEINRVEMELSQTSSKSSPVNDSFKDITFQSTFVSNVNVEDGQIFPAGAEFIKCWRLQNSGDVAWPETTRLNFIAGDRMAAFNGAPLSYHVGRIEPGATTDVVAADMKAPEYTGKHTGYWRLTDGRKYFGQNIRCEIEVVILSGPSSSRSSLHSSEVIMPRSSPTRGLNVVETSVLAPHMGTSATPSVSDSSSDYGSVDSAMDESDTPSDEEIWEASRTQTLQGDSPFFNDQDFVMLDEISTIGDFDLDLD